MSMLKQAVIDAKVLREAALKEAEEAVVEKYAKEIRESANQLLEQDDELDLDLGDEEDPLGAGDDLGGDLGGLGDEGPAELDPVAGKLPSAATEGENACACPDGGEEVEIDFDELAAQMDAEENDLGPDLELNVGEEEPEALGESPLGEENGEEVQIPSYLGSDMLDYHMGQGDAVYAVGSSAVAGKSVPKELVIDAVGNLESSLDRVEPEDREELEALLDELYQIVPEAQDEADDEDLGDLGLTEEILENILTGMDESLDVDVKNVPTGHGLNPNTEEQYHAENVAIAHAQSDEESAERKSLQSALDSVNEEKDNLEEQVKSLKSDCNRLRGIAKKAGKKLTVLSTDNAKLHYENRIWESDSLNERQKKVIVEHVRKADSVSEAKIVFETMNESVNGRKPRSRKTPETLTEHLNRENPLTYRGNNLQEKKAKPVNNRMQTLAGIKKINRN